ncbi:helix-turn-helix domain-containing protein [Paenibacillus sp. GCM10023252]|uniref:helix-turn-helix domain-containing protein n=1 Tax=Paenibacillus sp. GCM10023252 TaxID=3252649 RepID=UPI00361023EA
MERQEPTRLLMEQFDDGKQGERSPFHMMLNELYRPVGLHWHEFYELSCILEGDGSHHCNGLEEQLNQGAVLLLTPADFHDIFPGQQVPLRKYNVLFTEQLIEPEVYTMLFKPNKRIHTVNSSGESNMVADFHRLWSEYQSNQPGRHLAIRYTLNRILLDLGRAQLEQPHAPASPGSDMPTVIREVLMFIQHHFREPLSLKQLAVQAGLSPNYFSECFHRETGIPMQQYVLQLRLQFAMSLLRSTDVTVTEACYASGFHTLNYFERVFKKRYGMTPTQSRKSAESKSKE